MHVLEFHFSERYSKMTHLSYLYVINKKKLLSRE